MYKWIENPYKGYQLNMKPIIRNNNISNNMKKPDLKHKNSTNTFYNSNNCSIIITKLILQNMQNWSKSIIRN